MKTETKTTVMDDSLAPSLKLYGITISVADSYSPETKVLQQKLKRMCRLRRWLSFRMRKELYHRKVAEFMATVMQSGEEAMAGQKHDT